MALKQTFKKIIPGFDNALESANAYHKILKVEGNKDQVEIFVSISKDGQHLDSNKYSFKPSVEEGAPNFIRQGYLHLKTLQEFVNAQDC